MAKQTGAERPSGANCGPLHCRHLGTCRSRGSAYQQALDPRIGERQTQAIKSLITFRNGFTVDPAGQPRIDPLLTGRGNDRQAWPTSRNASMSTEHEGLDRQQQRLDPQNRGVYKPDGIQRVKNQALGSANGA
jgi:hypothetical protein